MPQFLRPEAEMLSSAIATLCEQTGIQDKVNRKGLDLVIERFMGKIHMRVELQGMMVWMIDHGHTVLRTTRLWNWFNKAYEIQKREARRRLEKKKKIGGGCLQSVYNEKILVDNSLTT